MVTTWDAVTLQLRQRHAVQPSNVASRLNMHAQGGGKIDPVNQDRTECCVRCVSRASGFNLGASAVVNVCPRAECIRHHTNGFVFSSMEDVCTCLLYFPVIGVDHHAREATFLGYVALAIVS